jgi:hypothetical protein
MLLYHIVASSIYIHTENNHNKRRGEGEERERRGEERRGEERRGEERRGEERRGEWIDTGIVGIWHCLDNSFSCTLWEHLSAVKINH